MRWGRAAWFILWRGMVFILQEGFVQVTRTMTPLWCPTKAWTSSCWFPCWETGNLKKGRFTFPFGVWAIIPAPPPATARWAHPHLSHPAIKPSLASPALIKITLCLSNCGWLEISATAADWHAGFYARFGWGVVPGLHICISTEDQRQHNLTLIRQRKAASQPCRFSSPFMWQQRVWLIFPVETFQVWH